MKFLTNKYFTFQQQKLFNLLFLYHKTHRKCVKITTKNLRNPFLTALFSGAHINASKGTFTDHATGTMIVYNMGVLSTMKNTLYNVRTAICDRRSELSSIRTAICNIRTTICDSRSTLCNMKNVPCNMCALINPVRS